MSMSKKDYQALAGALYRAYTVDIEKSANDLMQSVMDEVAEVLAADNPRFNRALFEEAVTSGRCKGMKQR